MSLRTKFFALTYGRQIARAEQAGLRAFRQDLLAGAKGHVVEIGGGTGANLPCYGPAIESLTMTEPDVSKFVGPTIIGVATAPARVPASRSPLAAETGSVPAG